MRSVRVLGLCACLAITGCETMQPPPVPPAPPPREAPPPKPTAAGEAGVLRQATWNDLPGWRTDEPSEAWAAFVRGCQALETQGAWREVCAAAAGIGSPGRDAARIFFEAHFRPFQMLRTDGGDEGLITGYYEPLLRGSRTATSRYRYPLYGVPDDLLEIDLAEAYPELKGLRLRGRLDGKRVVPYYDRAQIGQGHAPLAGREIAWVDDAVELFFLQVQGSGRIVLESGETLRIGYADHNGFPYRSIARHLAERGELPLEKASMQGIQAWARANPGKLTELLNHNARYIFFRELPAGQPGPLGSLGVPLTPRRSVAVDPGFVPLGAPVYIATTWPLSSRPLNRLMVAQDTGSAIRGAVRADYFWGYGEEAAREAGRMKQPLRLWVLFPNGYRIQDSGFKIQ
ncbi:MAG TPA: murein transglycosylase A [Burkholderiales bacterium]|jgi:membrane-bound lytic murein transglycosylase A